MTMPYAVKPRQRTHPGHPAGLVNLVPTEPRNRGGTLAAVIEQLTRDEILSLRHSVLRPGLPEDTARYPADSDPRAFHLAVRADDGTVISCVSFYPEALEDEPAWRFRGMATAPTQRGQGIGGELLEAGVAEVVRRGGRLVWCNGRTTARAFYERHGFSTRGEEFDAPPAGPHYVMARPL